MDRSSCRQCKKRLLKWSLLKWISRLMQKNGLDATDLEALFARVARREDDSKRVPLTTLHSPKKTN
jgi:hypothetical protein